MPFLRQQQHPPKYKSAPIQRAAHRTRAAAEHVWMPLVMKENETPDPVIVSLSGAQAVMPDTAVFTDLIKQAGLMPCLHGCVPSLGYRFVYPLRVIEYQSLINLVADYTTDPSYYKTTVLPQNSRYATVKERRIHAAEDQGVDCGT